MIIGKSETISKLNINIKLRFNSKTKKKKFYYYKLIVYLVNVIFNYYKIKIASIFWNEEFKQSLIKLEEN